VIDVGSLRGGPVPAWRLCDLADVVVLCATADPVSLVSTLAWIDAKGQSAPGVGGLPVSRARLLVVDAPAVGVERFRAEQVAGEAGDRLVGWWPWEPHVVDAVLRGATLEHRSLRRRTLTCAALATAAAVLEVA
jgi:hypothetical protein